MMMKAMAGLAIALVTMTSIAAARPAGSTKLGGAPTAKHADGWRWERLPVVEIETLACGLNGAAVRTLVGEVAAFDGRRWTPVPAAPNYFKIRFTNFLAVGAGGEIFFADSDPPVRDKFVARFHDGRWDKLPMPDWQGDVGAMTVLPSGELVLVGDGRVGLLHHGKIHSYDAGTWRQLRAVSGRGLSELWTAGQGGTVMFHGPRGWSRQSTGTTETLRGLLAHRASEPRWAYNRSTVLRSEGSGWAPAPSGLPGPVYHMAGPVSSPWAVGDSFVARFVAGRWQAEISNIKRPRPPKCDRCEDRLTGACATRDHVIVAHYAGYALMRKLARAARAPRH